MKRFAPVLIAIFFALFAFGVWKAWPFMKMVLYPHRPVRPQQPIVIQAAKAKQQQWADQIEATGSLSAFNGIMVKSQAEGTITKIYFKDGQTINKGDNLVQIYPDILEAQLASAQADLKLAKLDYTRKAELYKKNAVSKSDLDHAQATLSQDQAAVKQVQAQLELNNITAPFSGKLGLRQINLGQYVKPGDNIVNLQQLDPIRIDFNIPGNFIDELAVGQTVKIVPSSQPDTTLKGQVYAYDSAVDVNTRSLGVRAKLPNPDNSLLPGGYVMVTLISNKTHDVITVPMTAISYSDSGDYVYRITVDTSKDANPASNLIAKKVQVKTGLRQDDEIEVTSGLKVGDRVVTNGQVKLFDGSPVAIAPDDVVNDPAKLQQFQDNLLKKEQTQQPQASNQKNTQLAQSSKTQANAQ